MAVRCAIVRDGVMSMLLRTKKMRGRGGEKRGEVRKVKEEGLGVGVRERVKFPVHLSAHRKMDRRRRLTKRVRRGEMRSNASSGCGGHLCPPQRHRVSWAEEG